MNNKTIEKLRELANNNPDFAPILEKEFPEIIDNTPYVISGSLFMKQDKIKYIYSIIYKNNVFKIINIKFNKQWQGEIKATNAEAFLPKEYFLNKSDFSKLLKQSGYNIKNVRLISNLDINKLHEHLFDPYKI